MIVILCLRLTSAAGSQKPLQHFLIGVPLLSWREEFQTYSGKVQNTGLDGCANFGSVT